ncbi:MAG TPA: rhodanese-like domain-containing protein [Clostridiales bacterium]|nr:rhodanese-like domain-containing protein [Clostridiales bacterium]
MGFFDFFRKSDINQAVKDFQNTDGAVLLDVRTTEEYSKGHIPESKNIPLHIISTVEFEVENKDTPLFLYCRSGGRSGQAASQLKGMGYTNVKNIGGIMSYSGEVER